MNVEPETGTLGLVTNEIHRLEDTWYVDWLYLLSLSPLGFNFREYRQRVFDNPW